ncbi:MAG: DUF5110 domain-containing protein [Flavobacteriaceae bacterium]|nr:DUF5110 domain-containing protein [Flavobacteriaceae bacterium]
MKSQKLHYLFLLIILIFFQVSAQENVTKLNDGIEIKIKKPQRNDAAVMRIQVVSNAILHITASPTSTFDTTKSLMLIDLKPNVTKFDIKNTNESVTISTATLNATVSIETGEIIFKDVAGKTYHNDYTMMRGLPMDFNSDKKVLNIADQFMFGPALLVNPVTEYKKRSRELYLPNTNGWYNFYTSEFLEGGQTITAEASYEQIPLYIKEGSILPCGPNIEYTSQKTSEPFTIYVYTGKDASFSLYEDENTNYNYEKGKYSNIEFQYNEASKTLIIAKRNGSFDGMKKTELSILSLLAKPKMQHLI